jgi:dephospho-CoA kinase
VKYRHGTKPTIGLIGGIGAGKTTAALLLAARGGRIVNADAIGHEALEQPDIRAAVAARWGQGAFAPDGKPDRRAIARIVFADSHERGALEGMVFPYIRDRVNSEILRAQGEPACRFVVLDAAVMLEAGWEQVCDRIVYVDAPRPARLARLAAGRGWTDEQLAAREAAQWPAADKMKRANAVAVNDGEPGQLQLQIDRLLEEWGIATS